MSTQSPRRSTGQCDSGWNGPKGATRVKRGEASSVGEPESSNRRRAQRRDAAGAVARGMKVAAAGRYGLSEGFERPARTDNAATGLAAHVESVGDLKTVLPVRSIGRARAARVQVGERVDALAAVIEMARFAASISQALKHRQTSLCRRAESARA